MYWPPTPCQALLSLPPFFTLENRSKGNSSDLPPNYAANKEQSWGLDPAAPEAPAGKAAAVDREWPLSYRQGEQILLEETRTCQVVQDRKAYNLSPKLGCISELKVALISNYAGTIGVNQDSPQLTRCLRGPIVGHSDETKA